MYDYDPYPIPDSTDDGPEVALIRFFETWPHGRYQTSRKSGELNLVEKPIDAWRANLTGKGLL